VDETDGTFSMHEGHEKKNKILVGKPEVKSSVRRPWHRCKNLEKCKEIGFGLDSAGSE
jgi:hypothetical protein